MNIEVVSKNNNINLIFTAASSLGLNCDLISDKFGLLRISKGSREITYYRCTSSVNSAVARAVVLNKFLCSEVLRNNGFYVPESLLIEPNHDEDYFSNVKNFLTKYKNIVVKPNNGHGGQGVILNIMDEQTLEKSINHAAKYGSEIIAENFVEGKSYRVLIFMNQIIDIVERIPAYVIGNGNATIQELIDEKNASRTELLLNAIEVDESVHNTLSKQNININSIPVTGQRIELKEVCNLSAGGETVSIDISRVPKESLDSFIGISKTFNLNITGIDLIAKDIYDPLKDNGYINEVNSSPSMEVHCYANMKFNLNALTKIFKIYFDLN